MKQKISQVNVALRALKEFGIVLGLACWGYQAGTFTVTKILLAIAAIIIIFTFWGGWFTALL